MAFSAQVVGGVAVACGIGCCIITVPIVLWIRNWLAQRERERDFNYDDDAAQPLLRLLEPLVDLDDPREGLHDVQLQMPLLQVNVKSYVNQFLHVCGSDQDFPYDSAKLHRLAGGPFEDWDNLLKLGAERRVSALVHFICRVLYLRMNPDGDPSITLLPADMLSTYQRTLTKCPPLPVKYLTHFPAEDRARLLMVVRQYWRTFTVYWSSEDVDRLHKDTHGRPMLERPNCLSFGYPPVPPQYDMRDDDPRKPNLIALESELKDALSPFWSVRGRRLPDAEKQLECEEAQKILRRITCRAAHLAILAFSQPTPTEFYWPEDTRRPGPDPLGNGGFLHCFGMRQRNTLPGLDFSFGKPLKTRILSLPQYNDTDLLWGQIKLKPEDRASKTKEFKAALEEYEAYLSSEGADKEGWVGSCKF